MYVPEIELHEAESLEQASALMTRFAPDSRFLAGGTDLLVDLKTGRTTPTHVISINRIQALRGIKRSGSALRIGALTTISELNADPLIVEACPALLDASREMAAEQVRNAATVGGNLASAVPCADLPPILMTLGAEVAIWSPSGERQAPLKSFFQGPRQTVLKPDELLLAVCVPALAPGFGAAYERFALRAGNAIAVASVAASLQLDSDNTIKAACVALGAVSAVPKVVEAVCRSLPGRMAGEETFEHAAAEAMKAAEPISDVRGSAQYRRDLIGVLTPRALHKALDRARKAT